MNFIVLPFAAYFLTVLYFDLMHKYRFSFFQNLKTHSVYKYWTFCYQCVSFWLAIPILLLMLTSLGNVLVLALAIAGIAYAMFYAFELLTEDF